MTQLSDLHSRIDIELLVNTFYGRVRADDLLGPIFNEIAEVDWPVHLPKMYAFWDGLLFGVSGFKGNPLAVHRLLAQRAAMSPVEFGRWVELFYASVDELFAGPVADDAKQRASRIAMVMQQHIAAARTGAVVLS